MRKRYKGFLNSIALINTPRGLIPSLNSRVIVENEYIPYGAKEVYTLSNQYQYRVRGRLLKLTIEKPDLYLLEFLNPGYSYSISLVLASFKANTTTYLVTTNSVWFILKDYTEEKIVFVSRYFNQIFYNALVAKVFDSGIEQYVYALVNMSGYAVFELRNETLASETYPVNVFRVVTSSLDFTTATRTVRNTIDNVPILGPLDISALSLPSFIQHLPEDRWGALRDSIELDLL